MTVRVLLLAPLLLAGACSDHSPAFGPERELSAAQRPLDWSATDKQRLDLQDMGPAAGGNRFTATTPPGWTALASIAMRDLNYRIGEVECALLGDVAGTVVDNVNRWVAQQFGKTPLTAAQIAALPSFELLGAPARLVEVEGTFQGRPGQKLLGLVADRQGRLSTLKMTGPRDAVEAQREAFLALAKSIQRGAGAAPPPDAPAAFEAKVPDGWTQLPRSDLRDLNFRAGDAECALLAQVRGTVEENVNRWVAQQFGQPALSAEQIAALPTLELLGAPARLVEVEGTYQNKPGQKLLGLVADRGGTLSTLKMTGPKATVDAQRAAFLALAPSIRKGTAGGAGAAPATGPAPPDNRGDALADFTAEVPPGWQQKANSNKQLHYVLPQGTEVYLSQMGGDLEALVGVWRNQLGQQPLDAAGLKALPRIPLLSGSAVLLDLEGTVTDQTAGRNLQGPARMLVAAVGESGSTTFVKCLGPAAEVAAQRAAFVQFCASIRRQR